MLHKLASGHWDGTNYIKEDKGYAILESIATNFSDKDGRFRCYIPTCKHIFERGEKYLGIVTSRGRYYDHYSKICLPCINKILMKDEDRVNEALDEVEQVEIARKRVEISTRQR